MSADGRARVAFRHVMASTLAEAAGEGASRTEPDRREEACA
jgi:hypothetical protein